jgi:heme exporter protein CcmD
MDFETFLKMSGYALHVWGAYGISIVVYGGLMVHAIIKHDRLKKQHAQ